MKTAKTVKTEKSVKSLKGEGHLANAEIKTILESLPAPEDLAKYEKIIPGGAERILELAEKQCLHRQEYENRTLETEQRADKIRLGVTFVLGLAAGILGGVLLINGSELAGLIIILIDAAALVWVALSADRRDSDNTESE